MSCASKRGAHAKDKCFCPEKMRILETFSFLQFAFSFGWIPLSFSPPCVWSRGYLGARISGSLYSTAAESSRLAGLIFTGGKEGDFNQSYVGHALVFWQNQHCLHLNHHLGQFHRTAWLISFSVETLIKTQGIYLLRHQSQQTVLLPHS